MKAAAEQAIAGHGQIVAAIAEAGVGKSRLFLEFKAMESSKWMILEASSVSHGKASAFLPVIDLLHSYFRIAGEDDERTRREKVNGKLLTLDRSLEDTIPYLFALLGIAEESEQHRHWELTFDRLDEYLHELQNKDSLAQMDAQVRKRRTLEAIKRILLRESLDQPLMVIFEDLHWIDDETQALLNLLADSIGTAKLLLLVNYRPEYTHSWGNKTYYTQLRLDPLGKESAEEMLTALIGDGLDVRPLKSLIIERTGGNPFFMEETAQVLFDEGALVRNGTEVRLTKALSELKIPPTVQAILAARIDRLPAGEKDLLHALAVIGKEFQLSLVRAITAKSDDDLNQMLSNLQLAEFIYEQPAVGEVEYSFKHALTLEVAYNSVLIERRKLLHDRIGNAIEILFAGRLDDHLNELAHHYVRAGNADKATQFLMLAAQQAIWISALDEPIAYAKQGLLLVENVADEATRDQREAALRATLGFALSRRDPASREVEAAYLRVRELCAKLDDDTLLCSALAGLRLCYNFRAELDRALELGTEMLKVAERTGDPALIYGAHSHISQTLYFRGEFQLALEHVEKAVGQRDGLTRQRSLTFLGDFEGRRLLVLCLLGYPKQAEPPPPGLAFRNQPQSAFFRELFTTQIYYLLRDSVRVARHAERGEQLARDYGGHQGLGYIAAVNGWSLAASGSVAEGVAEIRRGLEIIDASGARVKTLPLTALAECYLIGGKPDEAFEVLSDALEHTRRTGERFFEAELHRLSGEVLALRGSMHYTEAETAFRAAIEVARHQQARWFELRGTVSLARLLRDNNRRDEARAMLADWFTEGFDTVDLKDAKSLLDELAG